MVLFRPGRSIVHSKIFRLAVVSLCMGIASAAHAKVQMTRDSLTQVVGTAKRHVDVMLPNLADSGLVQELRAVARDGRAVRVLVSSKDAGLALSTCAACTALEAAGADVRYLENKILDTFAIVDGPRTRFASGDLSELAVKTGRTPKNTRLLRFSREGDYVLSYQHEFNDLWIKARDYGNTAKDRRKRELRGAGGPFVLFSSTNMTPIPAGKGGWSFTPTLEAKTALYGDYIAGIIDYAYNHVDIGAYDLSRPDVMAALDRALTRGVRVRILIEDEVSLAVKNLAARGATVVSLAGMAANGRTPRLPANVILIDDKIAVTGNFQWTKSSEMTAFSSLLTLQGPVVERYRSWLNQGFDRAQARLPETSRTSAAL